MRIVNKILPMAILVSVVYTNGMANGLYEESKYRGLVSDTIASHIGDSLTILVVENASAETTTNNSTQESSGIEASASNSSDDVSLGINTDLTYKNKGDVTRSGKLLAKVTVTIHEILPSGELRVKGEQNITVNDELQTITITGNVRKSDVNTDNTVLSSRIANAKIVYTGEGFASSDKPGVITQFFRWLF